MKYQCRICDDIVTPKDFRAHLRAHNPNVDNFSPTEILQYFDLVESAIDSEIRSIWDNGGKTIDRYTVVLERERGGEHYDSLGLSNNPDSPLGFSQWSLAKEGGHLGRKIEFDELPVVVREHITRRLQTMEKGH